MSIATKERHRRFVAEFVVLLDAGAAARAAGYAASSSRLVGWKLLKRPEIVAAIEEAQKELARRTNITQDRVLNELALLAFSSVEHFDVDDEGRVTVVDGAPKDAIRAVSSIKRKVFTGRDGETTREVELKLWDKPGPLKLAGRHVGLFNDKALSAEEIEAQVDRRIAELLEQARAAKSRLAIAAVPSKPDE